MGKRHSKQWEIWIAHVELARSPEHPFYRRLNDLLENEQIALFLEGLCRKVLRGEGGLSKSGSRHMFTLAVDRLLRRHRQ